jgi:hypothetical protein
MNRIEPAEQLTYVRLADAAVARNIANSANMLRAVLVRMRS